MKFAAIKGLISIALSIAAMAPHASLAAAGSLSTLHAVQALSNADAGKHLPVAFEATVTYINQEAKAIYVQDKNEAIFVQLSRDVNLSEGDRVLIRGTTPKSFLPIVFSNDLSLLRHGKLPEPVSADFDDLVRTKLNCRLVRVRGVIRAADLISLPGLPSGRLQLLMDGGFVDVEIDSHDLSALSNLLDSEVEIYGVAARKFDSKLYQVGVKFKVSAISNIKVLKRVGSNSWSAPIKPPGEIIQGYHVRTLSQRLRIRGTVTYYQPGSAIVLQNDTGSMWVSTGTSEPSQIGDVADATGFPDTHRRKSPP
jgi:hypothetical protein